VAGTRPCSTSHSAAQGRPSYQPARGYATGQINPNTVRAAHTKTVPLRCVGAALHVGRQVGASEGRIVGPDRKLYAQATTTCAMFESRPAAP